MMNIIASVLLSSVAVMASLRLYSYFEDSQSKHRLKNATRHDDHVPSNFLLYSEEGSTTLPGDGSAGDFEDRPPPDFRPRGWPFLAFEALDTLFWYDLEWNEQDEVSFFPKKWYKDEELALGLECDNSKAEKGEHYS